MALGVCDEANDEATKKVKSREIGEGSCDDEGAVQQGGSPRNFREALLNVKGLTIEGEGVWKIGSEYLEDQMDKISFRERGASVVHVSGDEIRMWSKQWSKMLVVSVMGKRVAFKILENKINRDWAKKGMTKIIDMPRV